MTKEEAVKAAALGVPVVYHSPMSDRPARFRRISAVIWRYATLDGALDEKSVLVELLPDNGARTSSVVPIELVEAVNPEQWAVQKEIPVQEEKPSEVSFKLPGQLGETSMSCEATLAEKPKKAREVFRKPSVGEVSAYAVEMLYEMDAQAFVDHYESCGWVVGKNKPMRDWKAAVRNWVRRQGEFGRGSRTETEEKQGSFETDAFFEAALAKSYAEV